MAVVVVDSLDPMQRWAEPLDAWLEASEISPGRSRRAVLAFGRFSVWLLGRGLGAGDVDEDLIDEYIALERDRSGSRVPAAAQYLPLVKRFLAAQGVFALRPPASRSRGGVPRLHGGPLGELVVELVSWMRAEGYSEGTIQPVAGTAARLGCWMGRHRLGVADLDETVLSRFLVSQSRGPHRHPSSRHRMVTVRKYLATVGLLPPPVAGEEVAATPAQRFVDQWAEYMRVKGDLSAGWVSEIRGWVEGFVVGLATGPGGELSWEGVDVMAVNEYVTRRGQGYSLSSRRHLVSAMRGLMDWAFLTGRIERQLSAGVLRPATGVSVVPRVLRPDHVRALIAAADPGTAVGRRDRAIAVTISRLGLRAGEVAGLKLEDINWHSATITVRGKGGRVLTLPIPSDVGQVIVDYLRDGRPPRARDRAVFIRSRPPLVRLDPAGVSTVIAHLASRAGLGTVHAHVLRHTAATAVLAAGGSLLEARELLGHARTETTMVYARADLAALRGLAPAWGMVTGP